MEIEMLHLETTVQNKQEKYKHTNTQLDTKAPISKSSLYRKAPNKNDFTITLRLLNELTTLHTDSFTSKPGWLRRKFTINQRRKKYLNNLLDESGLAGGWCGNSCDCNDWAGMLHVFWHEINGAERCL